MKKDFNFTTAFAMRCDEMQYDSIKHEVWDMGYSDGGKSHGCIYFANNVDNIIGNAGLILGERRYYYNRLVIETFNRDLCLALAAMTDNPDGIVGEWWVCNIGDNVQFIKDKLYQQQGIVGNFPQFKSEKNEIIACDVTKWFRKATADELIKYFTESVVISASATNCQAFGNDAKASNYTPIEFKGQLQGFPPEVVEKMLERQVEQGNKRNVRVFELAEYGDYAGGGFNWSKTVEGYTFWKNVIDKKDFDLFFKLYPKTNKPEPDPQIEALQKRIEDLEYNVKQLAESMQNVNPPEPQPASRFADKQPLRAWDDDWSAKRNEIFWDAKNECAYWADGDRNGYSYDNYEPIPADQIPAWMIEAAKHLED